SRGLQRGQAKSSKSEIIGLEPDGAIQGRKRYSGDSSITFTLAFTLDHPAYLLPHDPIGRNIHVEPQRFCFCEQCPHDRQTAISPADLGGSNIEAALIRFHEKKLDNGGLIRQRHPEFSSRQPSAGVEAYGRF